MKKSILVIVAALLPLLPASHGQERASGKAENANPFFALCFDIQDSENRTLHQQAALLKELGYDGAGHVWLDNIVERLETLDEAGLKLFQVYVKVSIAPDKPAYDPRLKSIIPLLKGQGTMIALLVNGRPPSDPAGDAAAVEIVREIADMAAESDIRVVLYPHRNNWLERVDDAIRVVKRADRSNAGVMFNLSHWLRAEEGKDLESLLASAMPHLFAVSINGTDPAHEIRDGTGNWIQALDSGSFDLCGFLETLGAAGYKGPIGLQCFSIKGDARDHLTRSIAAWREIGPCMAPAPAR